MINQIKSILFFLLSLAIYSCNTHDEFPDLHVDPMIDIYKSNNIDHYEKYLEWKDSIVEKQTIFLNKFGLTTKVYHNIGMYSNEDFIYDSLNRVIEYKLDSDIHYLFKMKYMIIPERCRVIQYGNGARVFQYDKSFKKLLSETLKVPEEDVAREKIIYKYSGDKISEIIKKFPLEMPNVSVKTKYIYNKNQKLKIIRQPNGEVEYLSKNGLIDSVKSRCKTERIYYKYYRRK